MSRSGDNGHQSTDLLSVGQVASWLNVHTNTVRRWVENGSLSAYRIGSRGDRRIRRSDVEQLLDHKPRVRRHLPSEEVELDPTQVYG